MGDSTNAQRCAMVAIIGAPNAGKSTLTNALVGTKISIVTPKVQTTRARLLGICTEEDVQLILVDTPGIFKPKKRLDRAMVQAAWHGVDDADAVVLLADAKRGLDDSVRAIIDELKRQKKKAVLALNKVDLLKQKEKLLELANTFHETGVFTDIFMISALKGVGLKDFKTFLKSSAKEGPWLFPPEQLTNINERIYAAEVTREKLFLNLHQELPYALAVETETWEKLPKKGGIKIHQVIYVQKENHKGMVLGDKGARIKAISMAARRELEHWLECKVHLFLFVKVRERWQDEPEVYKAMGLDFVKY